MDKKDKLFELVLDSPDLTLKDLEKYFSKEEIESFIENGLITKREDSTYEYINFKELYDYREVLISQKRYEKVYTCLEKCALLNSQNARVYLKLLIDDVNKLKEEKFFQHLRLLGKKTDFGLENVKTILFLYNKLSVLPKKVYKKVRNYSLEDLLGENDSPVLMRIKRNIIKNGLDVALYYTFHFDGTEEYSKDYMKLIRTIIYRIKNRKENEVQNSNVIDYASLFALIDHGYSLDEAFELLGLSSNARCLVHLTLAKNYYLIGDKKTGDYHFQKTNKYKGKSEVVMTEYNLVKSIKERAKYLKNYPQDDVILKRVMQRIVK